MKTDCELLDALKEQFDLTLDYELCEFLDMSRTQISQVRTKLNPRSLTIAQRIVAYDHLGYAWARQAMLDLFPDPIKEKLRAADIDRTKTHAAAAKAKAKAKATGNQPISPGIVKDSVVDSGVGPAGL